MAALVTIRVCEDNDWTDRGPEEEKLEGFIGFNACIMAIFHLRLFLLLKI